MADHNEKILRKEIKKAIKKKNARKKLRDNFHRTNFAKQVRDKPFWIEDEVEHQRRTAETSGNCCFWHTIGLPEKEHLVEKTPEGHEIIEKRKHPMYDYEIEVYNHILNHRYVRIKKATGMGITTLTLGIMAHMCVKDDKYMGQEMGIVTGPRQDLANYELDRLVALFIDTDYTPKRIGDSVWINGCKITAYPSHTFDSARGLDKCRFFFVDEADFFPQTQIEPVMTVLERYEAKSHPYVVLNSTTNLPTGLYAQMDKGKYPRFQTVEIFYERGLGKIYTHYEIEQAKKMASFEREYNGMYGQGEGNIFPYQFVDACIEEYDLTPGENLKMLAVDPAYGSSRFAIVAVEKINDIIYVKEAMEFERPSPSAMLERLLEMRNEYETIAVDDSEAGLITELVNHNVNVVNVSFRDELSKMTMTSASFVKQQKVRIHPGFVELISQLKNVRLNDRGHPDKTLLSFDLGDAFMMAIHKIEDATWFWFRF